MARKKIIPKPTKTSKKKEHEIDVRIMGTITSDVERIKFGEDRTKCVFNIKSELGNEATVISWSNHNVNKGDKISVEGRFNTITRHIIIWSLLIYERANKNEN